MILEACTKYSNDSIFVMTSHYKLIPSQILLAPIHGLPQNIVLTFDFSSII